MFEYWMATDLCSMPDIHRITGRAFTNDSGANKIGVKVSLGGEPAALIGNVTVNIILPTGETITATGDKDGNSAWVVLPDKAYEVSGKIRIFLKLTDGTSTVTIGAAEGTVYQSTTSEVI